MDRGGGKAARAASRARTRGTLDRVWRVRGAPAGRRWPPAHHRDSSEPSGSDARGRHRRRRDHRIDRRHRPREAPHRARARARGRGARAADGVERRGRRGADGHGRAARVVRPLRAPRPRPDRARPHRRALHEPRRRPAQDLSGGKRDQGDGAGDRRRRPANPSLARAGARARGASRDASVHAAGPQAGRRLGLTLGEAFKQGRPPQSPGRRQ